MVLCGLGHYGTMEATANGLDAPSKSLIKEILARFPYISVRCDESKSYLMRSLPENADQILMTSCPVAYPVDGVDFGFQERRRYNHFVCTVTDRSDLHKQLEMLRDLKYIVNADRMTLALHQDYSNADLWAYARFFGYDVFRSENYRDFLELYKTVDLHVGNRVHAHLKCLSYGVRSFLTPFDLRHEFFASSLDFPIVSDVTRLFEGPSDFSAFLKRRALAQGRMSIFIQSVRNLLAS